MLYKSIALPLSYVGVPKQYSSWRHLKNYKNNFSKEKFEGQGGETPDYTNSYLYKDDRRRDIKISKKISSVFDMEWLAFFPSYNVGRLFIIPRYNKKRLVSLFAKGYAGYLRKFEFVEKNNTATNQYQRTR